ncbi:MAG: nucleotidyl transferase AbiEii/AbiGii toxin family protein [Pirellulaceae bacterium]
MSKSPIDSTPVEATRSQRGKRIIRFKTRLAAVEDRLRALRIANPLRGFNNSLQYAGRLAYKSTVTGQDEFIKIEVSVREPIVESATLLPARTLLLDPFRNGLAVGAVSIRVLSMREAYAEKFRAALSRRDPAIRDFFDLDHAFKLGNVELADNALLDLLSQKLSIPGNETVDMSPEKLERLRDQLSSQLRPVVRREDYSKFDLDRARQSLFAHRHKASQKRAIRKMSRRAALPGGFPVAVFHICLAATETGSLRLRRE